VTRRTQVNDATAGPARRSSTQVADEAALRHAFELFADPAAGLEVFTVRGDDKGAVGRVVPGDDPAACVAAVASLPAGIGIYWCLNPVAPTLAGRPKVGDILRRRWLVVDVDPVKTDGHQQDSATDPEHFDAMDVALLLAAALVEEGWPRPVVVDSGNGCQLLYRIDLPNNKQSQALVKAVLKALAARFDRPEAHVDTNPAGANAGAKLPGTRARKGAGTDERPHRPCRLLNVPAEIAVVPAETLARTAGVDTAPPADDAPDANVARTNGKTSGLVVHIPKDPHRAYAEKALEGECLAVRLARPGARQTTLNTSSLKVGHLIHLGLDEQQVVADLAEAAREAGLFDDANCGERHCYDTIRRALAKGKEEPRYPADRPAGPPAQSPAPRHQGNGVAAGPDAPTWPKPPAAEAYHGLAGRIVRTIEPHTESDPLALLAQSLVAFGSAAGRGAHFLVEADRHGMNEFVVLVGRTSKGRKGTSYGHVRKIHADADPDWAAKRIQGGLSSGEGVIWAIRDAIYERQAVRDKDGNVDHYDEVEKDPGVEDKRLFTYEPEFARALRQTERYGNTLSAVIRQCWDGHDLSSMTKNSAARATGPHVSLVGHVTDEELRRYLTGTEAANGFGNRHLFACTERSKCLPEGGQPDPAALAELAAEVKQALDFAREAGKAGTPVRRDAGASALWREVYPALSEGQPGLAGALLGRAEAHVLRLALIHAMMNRSADVKAEHLRAALALWKYCEASVAYVFGDATGDAVADEILTLLRASPAGVTRTDLMNHFARHRSSDRIGQALALLLRYGRVRCERQETGGRPSERWFAA
jgi:hypothetical protein